MNPDGIHGHRPQMVMWFTILIDKLLGWAKPTSITILDIIIDPYSLTNSTLEVWTLLGVPWTWSKVPWDVGLAPLTLL